MTGKGGGDGEEEGGGGGGLVVGMRRWCCTRRDTRGKRGYDGVGGAGMTVWAGAAGEVEEGVGAGHGEIPAASAGMTESWGGNDGKRKAGMAEVRAGVVEVGRVGVG